MRVTPWCLGLCLLASPLGASASLNREHGSVVAQKKKHKPKKTQDKCDSIGKPCKEGDDCKPDNCKPGGEAPAPQP